MSGKSPFLWMLAIATLFALASCLDIGGGGGSSSGEKGASEEQGKPGDKEKEASSLLGELILGEDKFKSSSD